MIGADIALAKIAAAPLSSEASICLLYRGESKRWRIKEMKANLEVVDEIRLRLRGEPR
jgi:hypothetical protein